MLMLRKGWKPELIKPGQNIVGKCCQAIVIGKEDLLLENRDWLMTCALTRVTGEATVDLIESMES